MLAKTAVVPSIWTVGETRDNTIVDTSTSSPAPAPRNKLTTPNLGFAKAGSSNFSRYLPTAGLSPDVAQIIRASWRFRTQSSYNTPVRRWLDFCKRRQLNPHQPNVSHVLNFLHTLHELGLSHSAIGTHQSAISTIVEISGVSLLGELVSVSIYERNLSPETSTTKIHQDMRCQQGIFLSGKSRTKWLTQFGVTDIVVNNLLTILGGRQIHTLYMVSVIHMDQSPDKVTFHITGLTKSSKPTRSNKPIVYRAYVEDELICPVKCIYAYLVQKSKIITQNFINFFISFGKPQHPASKDSSLMGERSNGKFWYRYRNHQAS